LISRDKFLWNARGNASVRASRIRNFTVNWEEYKSIKICVITAWIQDNETVKMGIFATEPEAKTFLEDLHKQVEELHE
jgi:hypothetical protein